MLYDLYGRLPSIIFNPALYCHMKSVGYVGVYFNNRLNIDINIILI